CLRSPPFAISLLLSLISTASTAFCTLSLHDALPIYGLGLLPGNLNFDGPGLRFLTLRYAEGEEAASVFSYHLARIDRGGLLTLRSEEHTSELQSLAYLVCRLLLEKKKTHIYTLISLR